MEHQKYFLWLVVLLVFVVVASSESEESEENVNDDVKPQSSYAFAFKTENGQERNENVEYDQSTDPKSSSPEMEVKGSYSFISADGYEYSTHFKAGKNGYQPFVTAHKISTNKT